LGDGQVSDRKKWTAQQFLTVLNSEQGARPNDDSAIASSS
jgi:hypothetical protein